MRQALLYAMDRKTLVDRLFEGMQPVADTWVNPLEPTYSKDAEHFPFDPAKAKALLAQAGFTPGPDGICRNAKGDKLTLELMTTAGNKLRELTQQVLQSQWKAACVARSPSATSRCARCSGRPPRSASITGMVMYGWSSNVGASPRATLGGDMDPDGGQQPDRFQLHQRSTIRP